MKRRRKSIGDTIAATAMITAGVVAKCYEKSEQDLQIELAETQMRLKDTLAFIEEKELEEDFNEWLHEHDLEKSS